MDFPTRSNNFLKKKNQYSIQAFNKFINNKNAIVISSDHKGQKVTAFHLFDGY